MALRSFGRAQPPCNAALALSTLNAGRLRGECERVIGRAGGEVGRGVTTERSRFALPFRNKEGRGAAPLTVPPTHQHSCIVFLPRSTSSPRHTGTLPVPHRSSLTQGSLALGRYAVLRDARLCMSR